MALLNILQYPDANLRKLAQPVATFDEKLAALVADMFETMYAHQGIGLAATQVNVQLRVVVMDLSAGQDTDADDSEKFMQKLVLINPVIIDSSKETSVYEEGCLSVAGFYDKVTRPASVTIRAQNLAGEFFEIQAEELLATCIQHEIDHLGGKVFVDHLSSLKQDRIKQKIAKLDK